jgi:hypothetical protein
MSGLGYNPATGKRFPGLLQQKGRLMDAGNSKRWYVVYAGVIVFTALVIILLFVFSRHFSG